jgi:hypothetical protein
MADVERFEYSDPAALAARLEAEDVPLVIRGALSGWPALERWTPERLSARLGAVEINYTVSTNNAHPDFREATLARMFARGRAPFAEFLKLVTTGDEAERARYLFTGDEQYLLRIRGGLRSVEPRLAPLLEDIAVPPLFSEARLHTVWTWFSGPGVRTWLHYDNNGCHNLNAQISGRKRCALFPPHELPRMHPFLLGGDNPAHNCSSIDVERPAPALATDLASASVLHAELEAGDLLFIPAWWFHTFEHLGSFNSNVNFWWKPERPRWNAVAARQALLDASGRANADRSKPEARSLLMALDRALVEQPGA